MVTWAGVPLHGYERVHLCYTFKVDKHTVLFMYGWCVEVPCVKSSLLIAVSDSQKEKEKKQKKRRDRDRDRDREVDELVERLIAAEIEREQQEMMASISGK